MSNFDIKGHGISKYEDRKKRAKELSALKRQRWLRADHIVDQVYCDLCNGVSKSDIIIKFANCQYDGQKKAIKERTAQDYIASAVDRIGFDREKDENALRDMLYSRYEAILQDAIEKGDIYNARGILDSIAKIFLPNRPETAIQINSGKEGGVTVNFGFEKKDED